MFPAGAQLEHKHGVSRVSRACPGSVSSPGWWDQQVGVWRDATGEESGSTWGEVDSMPGMGLPLPAQLLWPRPEPSNLINYQLLNKMQLFSRCCLPPQMEVHLGGHSISRVSNLRG